jgi:Site-specific recombinase XerD
MVTTPLRERMRQALRIRNMSPRTERIYLDSVARFALYFHLSPDRLGLPQIEQYLFYLRDEKKASYCWFNQCVCALRFFYLFVLDRPELVLRIPYGRRERHLPLVLSVEELLALLSAVGSLRDRVLLTVLYSAGIRLGEVCRLRVDDVDSPRMLLRIRQGKGHKDRFAPLSPIALDLLRQWWRTARPTGLLFPNKKDPSRPLSPSTVQRAVKIAARRAGMTKPVSPRTLRHSFATHLMEQGASMRVIQVLLGHAHGRTTEIYTHVSPAQARSPLDRLVPPDTPSSGT